MECPYCRQKMERGYLDGDGRRSVRWHEEGKKLSISDKLAGTGVVAKPSFGLFRIPGAYCKKCRKLVIDVEITE